MKKNFIKISVVIGMMFSLISCASTGKEGLGSMVRSLNTKSHGYQVVEDPTNTAPTEYVERFEVRDGDCGSDSGWSDCKNDRERSELSQMSKNGISSGEYWYGWSIYIPKNEYELIYPANTILGQFHTPYGKKPPWTIRMTMSELILKDEIDGFMHSLAWHEDMVGKWTKLEFHVKWSSGKKGFMRVYVNGEQIDIGHEGKPTHRGPGIFFKYGIYRSYLIRYKYQDDGVRETVPTQVVYYSNVQRGKDRESIQPGQ